MTISATGVEASGSTSDVSSQTYVFDTFTEQPTMTINAADAEQVGGVDYVSEKPILTGTAEASATVNVLVSDDSGTATYRVTSGDDGTWTIDLNSATPIADGDLTIDHNEALTFDVIVTDQYGNVNDDADINTGFTPVILTADLKAPELEGTGIYTLFGVDEADNSLDATDVTFTLDLAESSAGLLAGDAFSLKDSSGAVLGTFTVDAGSASTGQMAVVLETSLLDTEGVQVFTYEGVDGVGNSTDATTFTVDVDVADSTVTIDTRLDNEDHDQSLSEAGRAITGTQTGNPDEILVVLHTTLDDMTTRTATYTLDGGADGFTAGEAWSLDMATDIYSGDAYFATTTNFDQDIVTVSAQAHEDSGNVSNLAQSIYTFDMVTATPTLTVDAADWEEIDGANYVNGTPKLTGTAEMGSVIEIIVDDHDSDPYTYTINASTVDDDDTTVDGYVPWSLDIATVIPGLVHGDVVTFDVRVTDKHGNVNDEFDSTSFIYTADLETPDITFDADLDGASVDVEIGHGNDGYIVLSNEVFTGTAERYSVLSLTVGDGVSSASYEVTADASGVWSLDIGSATVDGGTAPALTDGSIITIDGFATDLVGNTSDVTSLTYTVDTVAPGFESNFGSFDGVLSECER